MMKVLGGALYKILEEVAVCLPLLMIGGGYANVCPIQEKRMSIEQDVFSLSSRDATCWAWLERRWGGCLLLLVRCLLACDPEIAGYLKKI